MRAFALVVMTLILAMGTAVAQEYQAGKQYHRIEPPQPTSTGAQRIEVIEFFSYGCPHCFEFRPILHSWLQHAGSEVELVRVPVTFGRPSWALLAKAYYAEKALNAIDQIHKALFDAIHINGRQFHDEQDLADFFAQHGVDRKAALDALDSFYVNTKVAVARRMVRTYGVRGTPSIAVDGKYLVDPSDAGGQGAMLKVVDYLIGQERALRKQ